MFISIGLFILCILVAGSIGAVVVTIIITSKDEELLEAEANVDMLKFIIDMDMLLKESNDSWYLVSILSHKVSRIKEKYPHIFTTEYLRHDLGMISEETPKQNNLTF